MPLEFGPVECKLKADGFTIFRGSSGAVTQLSNQYHMRINPTKRIKRICHSPFCVDLPPRSEALLALLANVIPVITTELFPS